MDLADLQAIGGKIGDRGNVGFAGVESLDQRHANNHFFPRLRQTLQVIQHPAGAAVGPLLKNGLVNVLQIGEKQVDKG